MTDSDMPVTVLDLIVLVVVVISAILAMIRGFVREALSITSWAVAAAAAYFFHGPVVPLVKPYLESTTVATIVAAALIFFIALIAASYITMRISDFVIDSRIGAFDRLLGFVFGAVRGILLLVIALLFFNWLVPHPPTWVAGAASKPMLDSIGQSLMAALPEDAEATILERLRGRSGSAGESPTSAPAPDAPPSEDEQDSGDYGNGTRQGMDQLIENSGPTP